VSCRVRTSIKGARCGSLAAGGTKRAQWKSAYAHETTGIATQSVLVLGVNLLENIRCGICCRGFGVA